MFKESYMRHHASPTCIVENSNGLGKVNANPSQSILDAFGNKASAFNEFIGMGFCKVTINCRQCKPAPHFISSQGRVN